MNRKMSFFSLCAALKRCSLLIGPLCIFFASSPALAQTIPISNHTVVRFTFQKGTNFAGQADVELFDSEKPETVRNFLLYVRSGSYSNMFLHRCVPGFIIQGGGFAST